MLKIYKQLLQLSSRKINDPIKKWAKELNRNTVFYPLGSSGKLGWGQHVLEKVRKCRSKALDFSFTGISSNSFFKMATRHINISNAVASDRGAQGD